MQKTSRHRIAAVIALSVVLLTLSLAACGGSEEVREDVPTVIADGGTQATTPPTVDAAGGTSAPAPPTATPVAERPSTSQDSLDVYIGTVCGGQSEVGSWEEGDSLRELSEALGFVIEGMGALEPPSEVAEWHDAQIAFAVPFKEAIDNFLDDPGERTEDQFLLSTAFRLARHFESVEQTLVTMNPDVRALMIAAGCIEDEEQIVEEVNPVGGAVITEFASISAGSNHTCGVGVDGSVGCWGDPFFGKTTPPIGKLSSISAGDSHTCGVRIDGTVACWGSDSDGQTSSPEGEFSSVSAGDDHTCGVRLDGTVACWGDNDEGQSTPPGGQFSFVDAGRGYNCGVRVDGRVVCWGDDNRGRSFTVPPDGELVSVSAGFANTCGVMADGSLVCWGQNLQGKATPPEGEFVSVSVGWQHHACGVRADGTVACWGSDNSGQATPPEGEFISVDAGDFHTCGIRADTSVACWGDAAAFPTTPASSTTLAASPTQAPSPAPVLLATSTSVPTTTPASSPTPLPQATSTPVPSPTPENAPTGGFGNGTWLVGTDIDPGIYVSAAPDADSFGCAWERLSGLGGTSEETVTGDFTDHRSIVEITASDVGFRSEGCAPWVPQADAISAIDSMTDGTWLVGEELTPGHYVAPGGEDCYWERLSDFRGEIDSIISNHFGPGRQVVEIEASDVGFQTLYCGDWVRE